jgi:hypothetical protein
MKAANLRGTGILSAESFENRARKWFDSQCPKPLSAITIFCRPGFLTLRRRAQRQSARSETSGINYKGEKSDWWAVTGFLISDNIILTNHHVVNSIAVGAQCRVHLQLSARSNRQGLASFKRFPPST